MYNFKNKKIIITGSLGLIGFQLSKALIKEKANLFLLDNNHKEIEKITYLKKMGANVIILDISKEEKVKKFFQTYKKKLSELDTIINLAAIDAKYEGKIKDFDKEFHEFDFSQIEKSINVNLLGTLNMCKYTLKEFLKNKNGNIINVASLYSIISPNKKLYGNKISKNKPANYVISKSSIPNFTRFLAAHYGDRGIRSNCIVPHGIKNNHSKEFIKNFSKLTPLKRMCEVEEIIQPIMFLASKGSTYINGANIIVDGGWSIS